MFCGAGWHVIKVVWGQWDPLIERERAATCKRLWMRSAMANCRTVSSMAVPTPGTLLRETPRDA